MSRQFDELMRCFNEFKDRFGEDDPLVSQWRTELDTRETVEFKSSDTALVYEKSVEHVGKTSVKNAALERLLARQ